MSFVYSFFIFLLKIFFFIGSLFHSKIRKGRDGRKQSLERVRQRFSPTDSVIWMHAASLGEYEQGLPVLEKLRERYPQYKVLVTFFSPSGYENVVRKKHPADVICYLPFDSPSELKPFLESFSPVIFFTIKYDFWYYLLLLLKQKRCKNYAIATHFYSQQVFFKPYGKWFVRRLDDTIDFFFHQTKESLLLAKSIGIQRGIVSGDTRFDRVKSFRNRDNNLSYIVDFRQDKKLVVFGSSWEEEEDIADRIIQNSSVKIIIAPHELSRISALKSRFPNAKCYSELSEDTDFGLFSILLIDSIGILSKLYVYADIAVVGGGFHRKGLHNILEAATFGVPVIFGNHYRKNPEADALVKAGGACVYPSPELAAQRLNLLLQDENKRLDMASCAYDFVSRQTDATKTIVDIISANF